MSTKCLGAVLPVAVVAMLPSLMTFGQPAAGQEHFADTVLLPGGMVTGPKGRIGFLPNVTPPEERTVGESYPERIDAVDLQTGKVLWTTKEASRPLLVAGDRLVALAKVQDQPNSMRVVVLDVSEKAKGKRLLASQPIGLPEYVLSLPPETLMDKGDLLLQWHGTISLTPAPKGRPIRHTAVYKDSRRVNLETGGVEELPATAWPAPVLPKGVEAVKSRDNYLFRRSWRQDALIVENKVAVVFELAPLDEKEKTEENTVKPVLRRWDLAGGKEHEPVVLLRSRFCRLHVSPDKRYVFAQVTLTKEDLAHRGLDGDWRVFSLETGHLVGRVPSEPGTIEVGVMDSGVYFFLEGEGRVVHPRFLKVCDLKSGKPLWTLRLPDSPR